MQLVRSTNQRRSIRGMVDLSGTPLNKVVRGTVKRMSQNNGPYILKSDMEAGREAKGEYLGVLWGHG
jgi:hypothetical protein